MEFASISQTQSREFPLPFVIKPNRPKLLLNFQNLLQILEATVVAYGSSCMAAVRIRPRHRILIRPRHCIQLSAAGRGFKDTKNKMSSCFSPFIPAHSLARHWTLVQNFRLKRVPNQNLWLRLHNRISDFIDI